MNVPNLKVTMFLTDVYGVGWQETHYSVSRFNPSDPLSNGEADAAELAAARAACLHASYYTLTDIRLSYDNVFRDSYLVKPNSIPKYSGSGSTTVYDGGVAGDGSQYQTAQSAIPMILSMRQFTKRAVNYLSGFLAGAAQAIRKTKINAAVLQPLINYGQYLCNIDKNGVSLGTTKWGTKIVLPEDPVGTVLPLVSPTKVSYLPLVGNKGTIIHINVAAPLDSHFAVGNTVYLNGWSMTTTQPRIRINGSYEITNAGTDAGPGGQPFIEVVKPTMFVSPSTTTLGTIQGSKAFVFPYQNFTLRQATHHKRGKPSFEPRGRR